MGKEIMLVACFLAVSCSIAINITTEKRTYADRLHILFDLFLAGAVLVVYATCCQ